MVTGKVAQQGKCPSVSHPWEYHRGRKNRKKSVGNGTPALTRLGEVLQAANGENSLAAAFRHQLWEIGEGSDIGQFIEREEHRTLDVASFVGGGLHIAKKPHDEGCEQSLAPSTRANEERVGSLNKCSRVELRPRGRVENTQRSIGAKDP